jgi:hypothetical protein
VIHSFPESGTQDKFNREDMSNLTNATAPSHQGLIETTENIRMRYDSLRAEILDEVFIIKERFARLTDEFDAAVNSRVNRISDSASKRQDSAARLIDRIRISEEKIVSTQQTFNHISKLMAGIVKVNPCTGSSPTGSDVGPMRSNYLVTPIMEEATENSEGKGTAMKAEDLESHLNALQTPIDRKVSKRNLDSLFSSEKDASHTSHDEVRDSSVLKSDQVAVGHSVGELSADGADELVQQRRRKNA